MGGYLISALAAVGLVTVGLSANGAVRSVDALPSSMLASGTSNAGKCSVRVLRTGQPGVAETVREQLPDGNCVCVVVTGSAEFNGTAEVTVSDLLRNRNCNGAPSANDAGKVMAGSGFGPASAILPLVIGAGGAGGLAVGLGNVSNG